LKSERSQKRFLKIAEIQGNCIEQDNLGALPLSIRAFHYYKVGKQVKIYLIWIRTSTKVQKPGGV